MNKLFIFLVFFSTFCFGQKNDQHLATETVEKLFLAMKNADSVMMKSLFTHDAILQSVTKDGKIKTENIENFISSISKLSKNDADEKIKVEAVHIDGNLASIFTPYEFYYKGKFSHCGANSFQLIKQNEAWKIQYLIDTRRTNCNK
ncbi:hypothetical protein CHRY9390_00381 [Chryseobacterium aquaeductus]|uniref:Lumazine-binding protein n=1 Tax=Chryseobacterium aquaeductus TaxID=2675056 RepID=A0A9N8QQW4_9FLAO|nr:nuclear transport factor 2 family protein [Chryseobacterium aquaeductus]CAA7329740.1 hypothetical protein CHRY9390_00381 [Chryseobacterium potabilaquae]CAD7798750.1 hypothetical protein CHRY9390_00381 [Chryseobacterium aquaeductus]